MRKAFTSVADSMRDNFRFGFSTAKEVLEEYGYSEYVDWMSPFSFIVAPYFMLC